LGFGTYPKEHYTQICWSFQPWAYVIELSLDLVLQVICGIQILTEGRPGHDSVVVLLEEVHGGSGRVRMGIVLLEYVVLVTDEIWHNVRSVENLETITRAWANILEDHRFNSLVNSNSTSMTKTIMIYQSTSVVCKTPITSARSFESAITEPDEYIALKPEKPAPSRLVVVHKSLRNRRFSQEVLPIDNFTLDVANGNQILFVPPFH